LKDGKYYRRAVEATRQNGSAWIGLAAAYDRLGRFDLADVAYRRAVRLEGENYIILNNRGYSCLLRGDIRTARRLLDGPGCLPLAIRRSPNNIAVMDTGLAYFHGWGRDLVSGGAGDGESRRTGSVNCRAWPPLRQMLG
jgi:tetratricopeptide (TPR) repeat protein